MPRGQSLPPLRGWKFDGAPLLGFKPQALRRRPFGAGALRTHQSNSDEYAIEDGVLTGPTEVAIPPYSPGHFRRSSAHQRGIGRKSRNPSVLTRAFPTTWSSNTASTWVKKVAIPPYSPGHFRLNPKYADDLIGRKFLSQSLRTHQGISDCGPSRPLILGDLRCPLLWTLVSGLHLRLFEPPEAAPNSR